MIIHEQKSNKKTKPFWDLEVVDNENGTISIPDYNFRILGADHYLVGEENLPFPDGSRLFIEKSANGELDYLLDTTGYATPASIKPNTGAILVVWRVDGEIHCLRSIGQ